MASSRKLFIGIATCKITICSWSNLGTEALQHITIKLKTRTKSPVNYRPSQSRRFLREAQSLYPGSALSRAAKEDPPFPTPCTSRLDPQNFSGN